MRASVAMVTRAPSLRPRRLGARALGARQVAVAGLHRHSLLALEVPDGHGAALHSGQRAIAAILGQPDRPADRCGAVLAGRAELALAVAPQLAEDGLGAALLLLGRGHG